MPEVVIERPGLFRQVKETWMLELGVREGMSRSSLRADALRARSRRGN